MNLEKLNKAIDLRTNLQFSEAEILFLELLNLNYMNPLLNYHYAWLLDNMGNEKKAIDYYEKALDNGLAIEYRKDCFLGLGSTFRMLGDYSRSKKILEIGLVEFPNAEELKVFMTMTLLKNNETSKAYFLLLKTLLELKDNAEIIKFSSAIDNFIKTNCI